MRRVDGRRRPDARRADRPAGRGIEQEVLPGRRREAAVLAAAIEGAAGLQDDPGRESVAGAGRVDDPDLESGDPEDPGGHRGDASFPAEGHENALRAQPADGGRGPDGVALPDDRAGLVGVAVEDVRPRKRRAEKGPGFPVRADDVDVGQGPEALGPAQHLGEVRVEAAEQADAAGVIDARPELLEQGQDRSGGHLDVRAGIGVIAAVLAAGDEDEVEGGRGPPGQDRFGADPRIAKPPGQECSEKVAAGREDDAEPGLGQAEPDEVGRDVAGVPPERRPHGAEGQLAGPGHPLEPAGDHVDDGDPADEDHRGLLPCRARLLSGYCIRPRARSQPVRVNLWPGRSV